MKIYDISQELFGGKVYPGDPVPAYERICAIDSGDFYNLTKITMGAHNGTHIDAPFHFYKEEKTIDQLELSRCVGPCTVIDLTDHNQASFLHILEHCHKRLLLKGNIQVTLDMAKRMNQFGIVLVGVEGQSVGDADAPAPVHLELLRENVVLLEGLVLEKVSVGEYFLSAAPLKAGGSDGAPCRAILLDFEEE